MIYNRYYANLTCASTIGGAPQNAPRYRALVVWLASMEGNLGN